MKTFTIIAIVLGVIVVAMYAYPIVVLHKKIKFHPKRVVQGFLGYWKNFSPRMAFIYLLQHVLPFEAMLAIRNRIEYKKKYNSAEDQKFKKLMIKVESGLNKDKYYKASIALADALAFGKFKKFEKLLTNDVQIMSYDQGVIQGKDATMDYWKEWKIKHVDTIDFDHFYRVFDESDFEIVRSKDDTHTCVNLMMTRDAVRFEIKDGRISKLLLTHIADKPVDYAPNTPSAELHEWPY